MARLVFDSGTLVVKLRYVTKRPDGGLIYQRRVPKDLKDHYGQVFMPRRSLAGLAPMAAAKQVDAWVKQDEAEWASLRAHPATPGHIEAQVDARLGEWLKEPRELEADSDPPTDFQHLWGLLDEHLLDTYGDAYYELKKDRYQHSGTDAPLRHRVSPVDYQTYRRIIAMRDGAPPVTLSVALRDYLKSKGEAFAVKSGKAVTLALGKVFATAGDKPLTDYTRANARSVRDAMLDEDVTTTTVRRRLNDIKAVFNFGRIEFELSSAANPFEKLSIDNEGDDASTRDPFTVPELVTIAAACREKSDVGAWIAAMMVETGARLSEIVGLRKEDVFLDAEVPHIWIREHKALGRFLKTKSSVRKVPLGGVSLWGATMALPQANDWVFPTYASDGDVRSNSASAAINPWLKSVSGTEKTCHSFRHSMIDRMREAAVPKEEWQPIVGHGSKSISDKYGAGQSLEFCRERLLKVALTSQISL